MIPGDLYTDKKDGPAVERAGIVDTEALVSLRFAYLEEDKGTIDEKDAEIIRKTLPDYFRKHLNEDLFVYVIREGNEIVSCAFLLVTEKPMSPAFITGKTGTVLNVFTKEAFRRRGYARAVMETLLSEAEAMDLSVAELQATEDGYVLYRSVGFEDDVSKYHRMKRQFR